MVYCVTQLAYQTSGLGYFRLKSGCNAHFQAFSD